MPRGSTAWLGFAPGLAAASAGAQDRPMPDLVAPVITAIPDIVISDADESQTLDYNLFRYPHAIDLDEYVIDEDTTVSSLLRWSFIQTAGPAIEINGIGSNQSGDTVEPAVFDLRVVDRWASFRNVEWSPRSGTPPFPDPPEADADSVIEMFVSDGVNTASQTVWITSIDDDGGGDRLVARRESSFDFAATAQGWTWFHVAPNLAAPTHRWADGALHMTETPGQTQLMFGSWELPKDPAVAAQPRRGAVLRARFHLRTSACGARCPGFRMRAITTPVIDRDGPGFWIPDFLSRDFNAHLAVNYFTPDPFYVPGREAGLDGEVYDVLSYPQQTPSLMFPTTITYFSCDLVDLDTAFSDDAGTITIDSVEIDVFDRPMPGKGTPEPDLSYTDFSAWTVNVSPIPGGRHVAATPILNALGVHITVAPGNQWFEATTLSPAVTLQPDRYYRTIFEVSSTAMPGGEFGPTIRAGMVSSQFVWSVDKDLPGGGILSAISITPEEYEVWCQAPSAAKGTSVTEPIRLRFESWLTRSNSGFPFFKDVSGTVRCTRVDTESFAPF